MGVVPMVRGCRVGILGGLCSWGWRCPVSLCKVSEPGPARGGAGLVWVGLQLGLVK